ncbi:MAG: cell division protein FtsL [Deltaproteobacteria bacterium]|nr:cell division protein FtsL [Deltaproteobacteria bacterium]
MNNKFGQSLNSRASFLTGFIGVLGHQRIKERRDLKNPGFLFSTIIVITIIVMVVLFYLWSRLLTVNIGYEISRAEKEGKELIRENEVLKLDIATLKSLARIEGMAKNELGLIYPSQKQVIRIK